MRSEISLPLYADILLDRPVILPASLLDVVLDPLDQFGDAGVLPSPVKAAAHCGAEGHHAEEDGAVGAVLGS